MAKIDEKKAILLISAIGGVITLGALAGVYFTYEEISATEGAIGSSQKQLREADQKIAQIPKLEDDVIVLRENVDTYTRILPDEKQVGLFTRTLNGFASQVGITIESWLPQKENKPKGRFTNYSYRLKTLASTKDLLRFMSLIENHERFMKISALKVRPSLGVESSPVSSEDDRAHDIDMTVETFVYNGAGQGPSVEIPKFKVKRERLLDRIQSVADAVALERYEYSEQPGRRDIFMDPRPLIGGPGPDQRIQFEQRDLIELQNQVVSLRGRFEIWDEESNYLQRERMRRELLAELDGIWAKATEIVQDVSEEKSRSRLSSTVLIPVREMQSSLRGGPEPDPEVSIETLEELVRQMRQDAANGDYQTAIERFDEVEPKLSFSRTDPRYVLEEQGRKIRTALETTLEFEKVELVVTGQVVYDEGRRGLLLNGDAYVEGEMVTPEVMLYAVRTNEADFLFRNLLLTKRW